MSIVTVIIVAALIGLLGWAISKYVPMNPGPKTVFNWAVVIILILWLIKGLGVLEWFRGANL